VIGEESILEVEGVGFHELLNVGVAENLAWTLDGKFATTAGRGAVLATIEINDGAAVSGFHFFLQVGSGRVPHPRCFFVRVPNKGVMVDAVCKSDKYRT